MGGVALISDWIENIMQILAKHGLVFWEWKVLYLVYIDPYK